MSETEQKPARSLVRKLAEVMAAVDRVPKNGRNDFHRYDYATESDITAAVRKAMAERHLMLVPDVETEHFTDVERKNGGKDRIATLKVRFTVMDGDSGEEKTFHVMGEGQDAGDKATYKALTGAIKYALLKLFLIPTGDDPEEEKAPPQRGQRAAPRQESAKQAEPPPPQEPKSNPTQTGTPYGRLWAEMKKQGIPSEEWQSELKKRGKSSSAAVTDADVDALLAMFQPLEPPRDSTSVAPGNP